MPSVWKGEKDREKKKSRIVEDCELNCNLKLSRRDAERRVVE